MRLNAGGLSSLVIGRNKEIIRLQEYIKMSQHVAIIAPRRYGKTTLVNEVIRGFKDKGHLIAKVDIFKASSIREFCDLIIDATYHSIGISGFIKDAKDNVVDLMSRLNLEAYDIKLGYDLLREQNENELVKKTLELPELFAKKHNKKMIMFFDEFGDLKKFGDDFIKKMRGYFQTQGEVVYIFAGSQHSTMHNIFLNKENAFFNFASLMEIGLLDDYAVKDFISNLEISGVDFDDNGQKAVSRIANNHPFYLIKLVQEAYIDALINGNSTITDTNVVGARDKILSDNGAFFEAEWQKINIKKYKGIIFKELCGMDIAGLEKVSPSYKSQIIKELIQESIVNSDKKPTDPFFAFWIRAGS